MQTEAVQIALIGLGGAIVGALLVAFVQPLWTKWIGPRARLSVAVSHHRFSLPQFLDYSIEEYLHNHKLNIRPTQQTISTLLKLRHCSGLTQITIFNQSKRTLSNVIVRQENNRSFIADAVIRGEKSKTFIGKTFNIGALLPKSSCIVTIWTATNNEDQRWNDPRKEFVVSVDEYDHISTRISVPGYISGYYLLVRRKILWNSFWAILIVYWIIFLLSKLAPPIL